MFVAQFKLDHVIEKNNECIIYRASYNNVKYMAVQLNRNPILKITKYYNHFQQELNFLFTHIPPPKVVPNNFPFSIPESQLTEIEGVEFPMIEEIHQTEDFYYLILTNCLQGIITNQQQDPSKVFIKLFTLFDLYYKAHRSNVISDRDFNINRIFLSNDKLSMIDFGFQLIQKPQRQPSWIVKLGSLFNLIAKNDRHPNTKKLINLLLSQKLQWNQIKDQLRQTYDQLEPKQIIDQSQSIQERNQINNSSIMYSKTNSLSMEPQEIVITQQFQQTSQLKNTYQQSRFTKFSQISNSVHHNNQTPQSSQCRRNSQQNKSLNEHFEKIKKSLSPALFNRSPYRLHVFETSRQETPQVRSVSRRSYHPTKQINYTKAMIEQQFEYKDKSEELEEQEQEDFQQQQQQYGNRQNNHNNSQDYHYSEIKKAIQQKQPVIKLHNQYINNFQQQEYNNIHNTPKTLNPTPKAQTKNNIFNKSSTMQQQQIDQSQKQYEESNYLPSLLEEKSKAKNQLFNKKQQRPQTAYTQQQQENQVFEQKQMKTLLRKSTRELQQPDSRPQQNPFMRQQTNETIDKDQYLKRPPTPKKQSRPNSARRMSNQSIEQIQLDDQNHNGMKETKVQFKTPKRGTSLKVNINNRHNTSFNDNDLEDDCYQQQKKNEFQLQTQVKELPVNNLKKVSSSEVEDKCKNNNYSQQNEEKLTNMQLKKQNTTESITYERQDQNIKQDKIKTNNQEQEQKVVSTKVKKAQEPQQKQQIKEIPYILSLTTEEEDEQFLLYSNQLKKYDILGNMVSKCISYFQATKNFWIIPLFFCFKRMLYFRKMLQDSIRDEINIFDIDMKKVMINKKINTFYQQLAQQNQIVENELKSLFVHVERTSKKFEQKELAKIEKYLNLDTNQDLKQLHFVYLYTQVFKVIQSKQNKDGEDDKKLIENLKLQISVLASIIISEVPFTKEDKTFSLDSYYKLLENFQKQKAIEYIKQKEDIILQIKKQYQNKMKI